MKPKNPTTNKATATEGRIPKRSMGGSGSRSSAVRSVWIEPSSAGPTPRPRGCVLFGAALDGLVGSEDVDADDDDVVDGVEVVPGGGSLSASALKSDGGSALGTPGVVIWPGGSDVSSS
jgi:hypothetical protein